MFNREKLYEIIGQGRVQAAAVAEQMEITVRELMSQIRKLPDASAVFERLINESTITNLIGVPQVERDILYTALAFNPEDRSLRVRIDQIEDDRWFRLSPFLEGREYTFQRHFNSDDPPFTGSDPMELWEYVRPEQKEGELILPQILLYYWHKDGKLSMELDW
jgi:hypothetical protein